MGIRAHRGQAAVELVAVLPLVAALLAGLWQLAVAGHAAWSAAGAAEGAARAVAVGGDARAAARRRLAAPLERGLRVRTEPDGRVKVTVRIPSSFGLHLGSVSSRARFAPQR
jgi:Flp pilus assembly protein TadG